MKWHSQLFGAKTRDIEVARRWIEQITGFAPEKRENDSLGGDYYMFGPYDGANICLINNVDPYDLTPVWGRETDTRWPIAARASWTEDRRELYDLMHSAKRYFVEVLD
ncbi:MAG: hypothetical protein EKK41_07535 [Hyphomicrobiales bacterium]|nr:MAG: hypothetical protein EKK41_07535 [Hyphomicrobiales bacterium]